MQSEFSSLFVSVFDRDHDVVVVGSGLIGFAAVRALFGSGKKVAWINPGGEILWEITRSLENGIGDRIRHPAWSSWLDQHLSSRGGLREHWLEGCMAEAAAAREILAWEDRVSVLINAIPFAVEVQEGMISALTVATKAGVRRISGRCWLDATEKGVLAALAESGKSIRRAAAQYDTLVFQSLEWEARKSEISAFCQENPSLVILPAVRKSERRFRLLRTQGENEDFALRVPDLVLNFQASVPKAKFLLSHFSSLSYPVYKKSKGGHSLRPTSTAPNLLVASPVWINACVASLADRFSIGICAADSILSRPFRGSHFAQANPTFLEPQSDVRTEIVVAGSGTAGAVATLAAARRGSSTIALDLAPFAGGIGSGGGISTYFHGLSGGLQDEIDLVTADLSKLFGGIVSPVAWHHEARKIALATLFRDAGASFHGETILCEVETDGQGRICAVLAASAGTLTRYSAKAFIDSTGDGDLCTLAGTKFSLGRPGDNRSLAYSQVAYFLKEVEGSFTIGILNFDAGWVDATDPEDLTRARLEGLAYHLHDDWPLDDKPFLLAPLLGVRQSRHIATDIRLELSDLVESTQFDDAIGEAAAIVDNHSVDFEFESDEVLFYLWVCRGFSIPLRTELPYRMLLPLGLKNTWVACRAAGISLDASYCVRMQRDMQRLGEAAGIAASLSVQENCESRQIDLRRLILLLNQKVASKTKPPVRDSPGSGNFFKALDRGESGLHLWHLARNPKASEQIAERLTATSPAVSFFAAAILAFQADARAEPRLLQALESREAGLNMNDADNKGAFSQCVAIPFWLQSIVLLRICGTEACLPALTRVLEDHLPFNVTTMVALTLERLLLSGVSPNVILPLIDRLQCMKSTKESFLPTTRSLWRNIAGHEHTKSESWGVDTSQDHIWQLHLVLGRIDQRLGRLSPQRVVLYASDRRAFVRKAFARLAKESVSCD